MLCEVSNLRFAVDLKQYLRQYDNKHEVQEDLYCSNGMYTCDLEIYVTLKLLVVT